MGNPFIRKLEYGSRLTDSDRALLKRACANVRRVPAHTELIREGAESGNAHLLLEGFAIGYKVLADGSRQIMAFLVPGDICDLHVRILGYMDHRIVTLVDSDIVDLGPAQIELLSANPRINRALWWSTLVDEATLREWLATLGQRPPDQQMAHIFCELLMRLQAVGRADADGFDLPFQPEDLADAMGIGAAHVSETIKCLSALDLIRLEGTRLIISDVRRLREFSGFTSNYLQACYGRNMGQRLTINQRRSASPTPQMVG